VKVPTGSKGRIGITIKNYRLHGSGRFHPLAEHLMEVRASAGNAVMTNQPNTLTVVSSCYLNFR
jgi:hypothetical protein